MKQRDNDYKAISDFLLNLDLSYVFKKKRLKYMTTAAVDREIRSLRDNFHTIWVKDGRTYRIKDTSISENALEILRGFLGHSDEVEAFLDVNKTMVSLNAERVKSFFQERISSLKARENLYNMFMGDSGDTMLNLVKEQIPYIEKYLPTIKKMDKDAIEDIQIIDEDKDNILHVIENFDRIVQNLSTDIGLYKRFMKDYKRLYREDARLDIIGYGEISTVMRLSRPYGKITDDSKWIWKKMPPFPTKEEVDRFEGLYSEYRDILVNKIGITVPQQMTRHFRHGKFYIVYAGQERVNEKCIGNVLIKILDRPNAEKLFSKVLIKLGSVYRFNQSDDPVSIGFDAQLSNWVLLSKGGKEREVNIADDLAYIDTSSPLIRINGEEQINSEVFIQSAASFLRPIIRTFFLQEVLDRYYDIRSVMIDIIANLHKEKRVDLIDGFIKTANDFILENKISDSVITRKEIDKYYSGDAFIWRFYQASRKIDRFITEKILRKKYIFRIPGKVDR